jgi:biopolymer transport protein ExbD
MRQEMNADYDPLAEDDDLAPLLDVKFILLIALMVVLTFFAQREFENRFAISSGPGPGLIAVGEQDYRRMVVVSLDGDGRLGVNGQPTTEEQLGAHVAMALADAGQDGNHRQTAETPANGDRPPVVFNADPTVPHGDAERVYLRLLRHGFSVLKEYQEIDDESETDRI